MFIVKQQTKKFNISPIRSATNNEFLKYEENFDNGYKNIISDIKDVLTKHSHQLNNIENILTNSAPSAKIAYINLLSNNWIGTTSPYSQVVKIEGITPNSQVDLMLNIEQLETFWKKNLGFVTENNNGIVTVYAIGQKPSNDYTFQVTITEVER